MMTISESKNTKENTLFWLAFDEKVSALVGHGRVDPVDRHLGGVFARWPFPLTLTLWRYKIKAITWRATALLALVMELWLRSACLKLFTIVWWSFVTRVDRWAKEIRVVVRTVSKPPIIKSSTSGHLYSLSSSSNKVNVAFCKVTTWSAAPYCTCTCIYTCTCTHATSCTWCMCATNAYLTIIMYH